MTEPGRVSSYPIAFGPPDFPYDVLIEGGDSRLVTFHPATTFTDDGESITGVGPSGYYSVRHASAHDPEHFYHWVKAAMTAPAREPS
jgi:hypothetical protein